MGMLKRVMLAATAVLAVGGADVAWSKTPRVLIFSHSTGYRHASIEPGVAALKALGARRGLTMVESADPAVFSAAGLKDVDAVVLLSNSTKSDDPSTEWLVGDRRTALQTFVRRGGGIIGIHAAADSHYSWPWYGRLMGGRFMRHPKGTPEGQVTVVDARHPANKGLAASVRRTDEWYYFDDYDPTNHVLTVLDPASIGEKDSNPNPTSWVHEFEGGRVFYTALGHTAESFAEPWFLRQLEGGLDWTLRR